MDEDEQMSEFEPEDEDRFLEWQDIAADDASVPRFGEI
jgi:hypothetical protein